MAKVYYQSARVRRFVPNVVTPRGMDEAIMADLGIIPKDPNKEIREVIRPAYLWGAYLRGKLKPMRLADAYWELMEDEVDEEYDCSDYWNYINRDGGLRY